jgi:hypothetical protein
MAAETRRHACDLSEGEGGGILNVGWQEKEYLTANEREVTRIRGILIAEGWVVIGAKMTA